ncbi:MAG TPA: twin-arginine translocation signal domain-containing protein [Pirellulaceae bacterium]|nr:twin-arginine translocation signal domain-containing protein [Pirellulaceae bacterium]
MTPRSTTSRRNFLQASAAAAVCSAAMPIFAAPARRPKVAAVFTELRLRSHAYNILINCMWPYLFCGRRVGPGVDVVSFYADQFPAGDMARDVSKRLAVPLFPSIAEALTLGGKELAVDAVLLIGEHGEYPDNELGQKMYPRKEFFDQIVAVMRRSERFVPVFNDKHLSYRWDWAKEMYDTARRLGIPLMAGSSVPLGERRPAIELPADAQIAEAVAIHGGGMEVYGYHGLELLQSFVESRKGGETGISRVQLLVGEAYEEAARGGRWSAELAAAAMAAERAADFQRQKRPMASAGSNQPTPDHAILVTYKDGTRGTVLRIGNTSDRWNFACRLRGKDKPLATAIYNGPWGNRNLFAALTNAILHFFKTGKSPYPVERTLLAGGAIDAAMHSHHSGGKPIDTPQLEFAYPARDFAPFRESGESWKVITPEVPQPVDFAPGKG